MKVEQKRKLQKIQPWLVLGLLAMSVLYTVAASYMVLHGGSLSDRNGILWVAAFAMLVALWTKNDALLRNERKPFEYSYFLFLFWPIMLPYHLIRSRGTEGLLMFLGFLAMHEMPGAVAMTIWAYFA